MTSKRNYKSFLSINHTDSDHTLLPGQKLCETLFKNYFGGDFFLWPGSVNNSRLNVFSCYYLV